MTDLDSNEGVQDKHDFEKYEKEEKGYFNLLPQLDGFYLTRQNVSELCFRENLLILTPSYKKVGDLIIDVSAHRYHICVHAHARHTYNEVTYGMNMTGYLDKSFNTFEEKRIEYKIEGGIKVENHLCVVRRRKCYNLVHSIKRNDGIETQAYREIPIADMEGYISETANLLFLRQLAKYDFFGKIQLFSFCLNMDAYEISYEVYEPRLSEVNRTEVLVTHVERTNSYPNGSTSTCSSYLTALGQLLKLEWSESDFRVLLDPRAKISTEGSVLIPEISIPVSERYTDFIELTSMFDREFDNILNSSKTYLADHPAIKQIIASFLKQLLIQKPEIIIPFAANYFSHTFPL